MEGRRRTSLPKRGWMDSAHVDVREKGQTGRRNTAGLYGDNVSYIAPSHGSGNKC